MNRLLQRQPDSYVVMLPPFKKLDLGCTISCLHCPEEDWSVHILAI